MGWMGWTRLVGSWGGFSGPWPEIALLDVALVQNSGVINSGGVNLVSFSLVAVGRWNCVVSGGVSVWWRVNIAAALS